MRPSDMLVERFRRDRLRMAQCAAFVLVASSVFPYHANGQVSTQKTGLRVVVIEGEDAVNIVQQKTAVAPVVEVRDRNDQPISGAVVTFAIRSGRATFGGARTLTITTNAMGRAVATGITPSGTGIVQISASAAFQGQTAVATIVQTNVLTAAQAAAVSPAGTSGAATAGGSGGGLSSAGVAGIAGAAGAAALVALTVGGDEFAAALPSIRVDATFGIRDVTVFTFTASGGTGAASGFQWEFGDGATGTGTSVTHVFARAGTFSVRVTDGETSATVPMRIGGLDGTWGHFGDRDNALGLSYTHRLSIVQQGTNLSGTWTVESVADPGRVVPPHLVTHTEPLRGSLQSPRFVTTEQLGECFRAMTLAALDESLDVIAGSGTSGNPNCEGNRTYRFIRQ